MKPLHERRRRSAREAFANCRFSYRAMYIDDVTTESNATRRGSCFHEARARSISKYWHARVESDYELAAEALNEACILHPLPWEEWQDVRQLWSRWVEGYTLNLQTFVSVEAPIRSQFGSDLRLDELHAPDAETLRAIDCKTWWRIPSQGEMAQSFQTQMYLAAMRHVFPGFRRYQIVFDIPRYGVQSDVIEQTQGEADEFAEFIRQQDEALDIAETSHHYPATPGAHCRHCTARCPLVEAGERSVERLLDQSAAQSVVARLAVLHRETEHLQATLRAFAEQHGPVENGGIEWAFRPQERSVYPAKQVLDVLEGHGFDANVMLSGSAVKPFLTSKRKYIAIADEIKALAKTKVATVFLPKRMADDERAYEDADDSETLPV